MEAIRDLLAKPNLDDVPMIREALDDAASEAVRAGQIVRRLREFVARGEVEKAVEDLPQLIAEAAELALMGAHEKGVANADAIVADYRLPDNDGVRLLQNLRKAGFDGPAILVTGFGTPALEMSARAAGYARVLEKPLADRILRETMAGLFA